MHLKFDDVVFKILKEQTAGPLAGTMGNPGYAGTAAKPNMAQFTGFTNASKSSDPSSSSDPGSSPASSTQFAANAMGTQNANEQLANQLLGMGVNNLEKIVNMRDASSAAQSVRSIYSQLDPTGSEAVAKSLETPNFNWDEFKSTIRNKISQLGSAAGSLVG